MYAPSLHTLAPHSMACTRGYWPYSIVMFSASQDSSWYHSSGEQGPDPSTEPNPPSSIPVASCPYNWVTRMAFDLLIGRSTPCKVELPP